MDLHDFHVGDYVLARVDLNRRLVLQIQKLPPPTGDDRYWEAIHRLQAETANEGL